MKLLVLTVALFQAFLAIQAKKEWALLVGGSEYNPVVAYGTDTSLCLAYQLMREHGIPEENIILMMKASAVNYPGNPKPGTLYPFKGGPDVWKNCKVDYTGNYGPEEFLDVLTGKGSGKTLQAGPEDDVFVYFMDHGGPGIIAFPDNKLLTAKQLIDALKDMHAAKKFGRLTMYIDACNSGSMFKGVLPSNINVFGVSATNATHEGACCDCTYGKETLCMSCIFSAGWLHYSYAKNLGEDGKTLEAEFKYARKFSAATHYIAPGIKWHETPHQFGDMGISKMSLAQFQGDRSGSMRDPKQWCAPGPHSVVRSQCNDINNLKADLMMTKDPAKAAVLRQKLGDRQNKLQLAKKFMREFAEKQGQSQSTGIRMTEKVLDGIHDLACHDTLVRSLYSVCREHIARNPFLGNTYINFLNNVCQVGLSTNRVLAEIQESCLGLASLH